MRFVRWCRLCAEREVNGQSDHCARCQAGLDEMLKRLEEMLDG